MKKKKTYFYAVFYIILSLIIFYFGWKLENQYELPFFNPLLVSSIAYGLAITFLTPIFLVIINQFYVREIEENRKKFRYKKINKFMNYFIFILLTGFVLFFVWRLFFPQFITLSNFALIKINEVIGKPVIKEFLFNGTVQANPTHQQKINIGSHKHSIYVIDTVTHKINFTLSDNKREYSLKQYCLTQNLNLNIQKYKIQIEGYNSFLGFSAQQNQHLSNHVSAQQNINLDLNTLNSCELIYYNLPRL